MDIISEIQEDCFKRFPADFGVEENKAIEALRDNTQVAMYAIGDNDNTVETLGIKRFSYNIAEYIKTKYGIYVTTTSNHIGLHNSGTDTNRVVTIVFLNRL